MHILPIVYGLLLVSYTLFKNIKDIHGFQQNLYNPRKYWIYLNGKHNRFFKDSDYSTVLSVLLFAPSIFIESDAVKLILFFVSLPPLMFSHFVYKFWTKYHMTKLKLKYTDRVKRLLFTTAAVTLLLSLAPFAAAVVTKSLAWELIGVIGALALNILSFVSVMLAGFINKPIETRGANYFVNDAKRILAENKNLIVIGITGSYGKTSVKNILGKMLAEKYSVLITPESYNTTMGVVRTVRERLKPYHEVFVVEMGAHEPGDIKEICDIVNPKYSLITSIGEQHLETFKTLENVILTKGELFDGTIDGGTVFINLSDEHISKIHIRASVNKVTYLEPFKPELSSGGHMDAVVGDSAVAAKQNLPDPFVSVIRTNVTGSGSEVIMRTDSGQEFGVFTKLLGRHNIDNITACASVALKLGVTPEQINKALFDIEPVKHRLSYHKAPGGYMIIDDAFNSNPVGSRNALEVLRLFEGGKKYVITPGMIELGPRQDEYNRRFGGYIASGADFAVLVGEKQTRPIYEGIIEAGYDPQSVYVAKNLADAFDKVHSMIKPGDVLLLENDLPDIFNEN